MNARSLRGGRPAKKKLGRGGEKLLRIAQQAGSSSSRIEDAYWDIQLANVLKPLLTEAGQQTIEAVLERLSESDIRAYDFLADALEAAVECAATEHDGQAWQCLMVVMPILAWSRGAIPAGKLSEHTLEGLNAALKTHVFADDVQFALADQLLTPDQLPISCHEELILARQLFQAALSETTLSLNSLPAPIPVQLISDARYIVGAAACPKGAPIFRWQQGDRLLETAQDEWPAQIQPVLQTMFAGCQLQVAPPVAYFQGLRHSARSAAVFHLEAGIDYLRSIFSVPAAEISAASALFFDGERPAEYRIGLTVGKRPDLFHGAIWPVLDEQDASEAGEQIKKLMVQHAVGYYIEHEHRFIVESSEDYGDPLFPNINGDAVTARLPEDFLPTTDFRFH